MEIIREKDSNTQVTISLPVKLYISADNTDKECPDVALEHLRLRSSDIFHLLSHLTCQREQGDLEEMDFLDFTGFLAEMGKGITEAMDLIGIAKKADQGSEQTANVVAMKRR